MESKICNTCGLPKPISAFSKWNKAGKTYIKNKCSACKSRVNRHNHPQNIAKIKKVGRCKYKSRQTKMRMQLCEAVSQTSCQCCGFTDIRALCFHHRDPGEKQFRISWGITHSYSFDALLQEAKKCDVLCQNCHTIFHCGQRSKGQ